MTMRHREWLYRLVILLVTWLAFAYWESMQPSADYVMAFAKAAGIWIYALLFHSGIQHRHHDERHH